MKARPGQRDIFGGEAPPEKAMPMLVHAGFAARSLNGRVLYADPFNPTLLLTPGQARALLHKRQERVMEGGWRVQYPEGRHVSARIGIRRATIEGAWHEIHAFTGGLPADVQIIDATGRRVDPPLPLVTRSPE